LRKGSRIAAAVAAMGALFAPGTAHASVGVGQSGWNWGNPQPQGNTLHALAFAGNRGYAVGDFGTVLRTDDAGATWSGLRTGITSNLTTVRVLDADTFVVGGGCTVRRSDNGGVAFTRLPFTSTDVGCPTPLASLFFPSKQVGYIVLTDGTVLRTPDGGQSFARKTAVPGTRAARGGTLPTDLFFLSDDTGFAATEDGTIYRTTDGGNSWSQVHDAARAVRGFFFVDANTGFAVGDGSTFLKTTNGGTTWTSKDIGAANIDLTAIRCGTPQICLASTRQGNQLVRTTDGGTTFALVTPSTESIFFAAFASPGRAAAVGQAGATVVSNDGGATYAPIGGRLPGAFFSLSATPTLAFAPGDNGNVAVSSDGGKTWRLIAVPTSQRVVDIAFPTTSVGFALDAAGGLFKTTNLGATWSNLDIGTTARPGALVAIDTDRVLLIGPTGIRRSADGGNHFSTSRDADVKKAKLSEGERVGHSVFAWGLRDLVVSTDGGRKWRALHKPGRVRDVDFVSSKKGFFLDTNGRAWRTTNAARRWTELAGIGTDRTSSIDFSTSKKGYVVAHGFSFVLNAVSGGFALRTSDAGKTWRPQLVSSDDLSDVGAGGGGIDYALDRAGGLFWTQSGGDFGDPSNLTIRTAHSHLRKTGRIRVTGRLSPARGGEQVLVSQRRPKSTRWISQVATVGSNGTFTTSWNLRRGLTIFVGQWLGNDRNAADGSKILKVRVG
jgi:photosystem II stability/assembly factor-like uncharacterized protein